MAKMASGFRKNEKIIATEDLVGVPRGTKGKVKLINGVTWKRYWVFFENGVQRGSIDGSSLVRASEWDTFRINEIAEASKEPSAEVTTSTDAPAAADAGSGGGESKIPAHLLERSKKAKAAKGGGGAEDAAPAAEEASPAASEAASKVPAHLLERAKAAKAKKAAG